MPLLPINQNQGQQQPTQRNSGSLLDAALDIVDPSGIRKSISGIFSGGGNGFKKRIGEVGWNLAGNAKEQDWRLRISLADSADYFYSGPDKGIMAPLFKGNQGTNGVIFPYTPQVQLQYTARYANQKLTHSNYDAFFYEGSEVAAINITGDFTVQNLKEGQYLLAALYFFRASTKMWFGKGNEKRVGNPPPMVFLNGYGTHYFPNVPCVVTTFSHTMPQDCDYLEIPSVSGGGSTRLPTTSQVSVTLQPVYSRKTLHDKFSLDDFAAGKLVKGNGGFL
jgi:hypothetical protein